MIRKIDEENTKSEKFVYFQRFDEISTQFQCHFSHQIKFVYFQRFDEFFPQFQF